MLEYHAAYYQVEHGWYMAVVLDFPGVLSQGRTLRSARRMIRDALQLMAEWRIEEGMSLPNPNAKAKSTEGKPAFREKIPLIVKVKAGVVP